MWRPGIPGPPSTRSQLSAPRPFGWGAALRLRPAAGFVPHVDPGSAQHDPRVGAGLAGGEADVAGRPASGDGKVGFGVRRGVHRNQDTRDYRRGPRERTRRGHRRTGPGFWGRGPGHPLGGRESGSCGFADMDGVNEGAFAWFRGPQGPQDGRRGGRERSGRDAPEVRAGEQRGHRFLGVQRCSVQPYVQVRHFPRDDEPSTAPARLNFDHVLSLPLPGRTLSSPCLKPRGFEVSGFRGEG